MTVTAQRLRPQRPAAGKPVRQYILDLAAFHGVSYVFTPDDDMSNAHARLSDCEVELDEAELLLLQLRRDNILTGDQKRDLLDAYIRCDLGLN